MIELVAALVPVILATKFLLDKSTSSQIRGAIYVVITVIGVIGRNVTNGSEIALVLVLILLVGIILLLSVQKGKNIESD